MADYIPLDLSKVRNGAEFREAVRRSGGLCSDGPVGDDFTAGWAKHPFVAVRSEGRAHYWEAGPWKTALNDDKTPYRLVDSACGIASHVTKSVPLLGPGNYEFCARCENKLMRGGFKP